jgi:hypothetical protein
MSARQSIAMEERGQEREVLREVLEQHPAVLSEGELIRAVGGNPADSRESEPWERAIRELGRQGLLRLEGETVFPTLAALCAEGLLEE